MTVSSGTKWNISFLSAFIFLFIVGMFKLISSRTSGLIDKRGYANWISLLVQGVLFLFIIRLMMVKPLPFTTEKFTMQEAKDKYYPGFNGFVSPADMMRCNDAQLIAENQESAICYNAARSCLSDPYGKECRENINACKRQESDKYLSKLVSENCGFIDRN